MGQSDSSPRNPLPTPAKGVTRLDIRQKLETLFPGQKNIAETSEIHLVDGEVFSKQPNEAYFVLSGTMREESTSSPTSRNPTWFLDHSKSPGMILMAHNVFTSEVMPGIRLIAEGDASILPIPLEQIRMHPEALCLVMKAMTEDAHRIGSLLTVTDELGTRLRELAEFVRHDPDKPKTALGILNYLTTESKAIRDQATAAQDQLLQERELIRDIVDGFESERARFKQGSGLLRIVLAEVKERFPEDQSILGKIAQIEAYFSTGVMPLESKPASVPNGSVDEALQSEDGERITHVPEASVLSGMTLTDPRPIVMPTVDADAMPPSHGGKKASTKGPGDTDAFPAFNLDVLRAEQEARERALASTTLVPPTVPSYPDQEPKSKVGALIMPSLEQKEPMPSSDDVRRSKDHTTTQTMLTPTLEDIEAYVAQAAQTEADASVDELLERTQTAVRPPVPKRERSITEQRRADNVLREIVPGLERTGPSDKR
jgi:hypothetical protein